MNRQESSKSAYELWTGSSSSGVFYFKPIKTKEYKDNNFEFSKHFMNILLKN